MISLFVHFCLFLFLFMLLIVCIHSNQVFEGFGIDAGIQTFGPQVLKALVRRAISLMVVLRRVEWNLEKQAVIKPGGRESYRI